MTREELKHYIDNCILVGDIVNENSEIYKTLLDYSQDYTPLLANLLGSVYIDGLYVKRDQNNKMHLVYYDGEYETLELGDCIDAIDIFAFTPHRMFDTNYETHEYHPERMNLVSVSGSSVTSIKTLAFQSSSVKEVNFPNVREIGYRCFDDSRVEHTVFNELESIPTLAFINSSLKSFEGKNVKCVSRCAFESCHNLTQVYLPLAELIEESAFLDCNNLRKANIIIKDGVTRWPI